MLKLQAWGKVKQEGLLYYHLCGCIILDVEGQGRGNRQRENVPAQDIRHNCCKLDISSVGTSVDCWLDT